MLLKGDLRDFLGKRYAGDGITAGEIESVSQRLDGLPAADLYESNKRICKMVVGNEVRIQDAILYINGLPGFAGVGVVGGGLFSLFIRRHYPAREITSNPLNVVDHLDGGDNILTS